MAEQKKRNVASHWQTSFQRSRLYHMVSALPELGVTVSTLTREEKAETLLHSHLSLRYPIIYLPRAFFDFRVVEIDGPLLTRRVTSSVGVAMSAERGGTLEGGVDKRTSLIASLSADVLHEVQQYEKLLKFRDEVLSGAHPRIKPPQLGKVAQAVSSKTTALASSSTTSTTNSVTAVNGSRPLINNMPSFRANHQVPPVNMATNVPGLGMLSQKPFGSGSGSGKPAIDPVLLEKSDDLVKAEIQLRRQKIERALKDEVEQRRVTSKPHEQMADLDVNDILAKAMTLSEDAPPQPTDDAAANTSASSDSFDNNTFYSSQHGTPDSVMAARIPNESEDEEMREESPYEPEFDPEPDLPTAIAHAQSLLTSSQSIPGVSISQHQPQPAQTNSTLPVPAPSFSIPGIGAANTYGSGQASRPGLSGSAGSGPGNNFSDFNRANQHLLSQTRGNQNQTSPVVRGHDLSPLAPQPERVSPLASLAITRQPHLVDSDSSGRRATPAQVAALRKQTSNASSPESSPQASKAADKKKSKKKNKRKADRLAVETAVSPVIKPEPRSPSPMTAAPYARPNKRQKQGREQAVGSSYEEHRYQAPIRVETGYQECYQPNGSVRQERVVAYGRADGAYRPRYDDEPILVTSPRYERVERVYYDESRQPVSARPIRADSPGAQVAQYAPREVRTARPVSYEEGGAIYRDVRAASRMSMRPAAYGERSQSPIMYERPSAAMPPPRAPVRRILVDAHGREYLEPIRSTPVMREEVISDSRGERLYPAREMSRRPEVMDDDVIYQGAQPVYGAPRRVVTQPEYGSYRESTNPMAPPPLNEYAPSRAEPPREYMARPASVRPGMETVRYEPSTSYERVPFEDRGRDYYGAGAAGTVRSASVRPGAESIRYEVPVAYERRVGGQVEEYVPLRSASVRPGPEAVRYDPYGGGQRVEYAAPPPVPAYGMQPPPRSYSVLPAERVVERGYSIQPPPPPPPQQGGQAQGQAPPGGGGYYARPAGREDDEVVYLDRPPLPPQREVYRDMR
ncbi:hypothetical protein QBC41DRAFT_354486 [Cercophora samala]|uniref:Uncharacterized protein n=1 Tax=Cercophora samala TaxID=330535 RepID=A0AA39ZHD0_9PEZI|nr:hypothetical protein QBC41DRAFT_354486 [Cercophora samala]